MPWDRGRGQRPANTETETGDRASVDVSSIKPLFGRIFALCTHAQQFSVHGQQQQQQQQTQQHQHQHQQQKQQQE